jgi:hypothetical protein
MIKETSFICRILKLIASIYERLKKLRENRVFSLFYRVWAILSLPGIFIAGRAFRNGNIEVLYVGSFLFAFWGLAFYELASNLVCYYFIGKQADNYEDFIKKELRTNEDKKTATQLRRNRVGAILIFIFSLSFLVFTCLPFIYPNGWVFVENFLFTIPAAICTFFFVASLGITFGMWVGSGGTFIKFMTTAESLSYFGVDRVFIILGIIAALWVVKNGVMFSFENRLFISLIF